MHELLKTRIYRTTHGPLHWRVWSIDTGNHGTRTRHHAADFATHPDATAWATTRAKQMQHAYVKREEKRTEELYGQAMRIHRKNSPGDVFKTRLGMS